MSAIGKRLKAWRVPIASTTQRIRIFVVILAILGTLIAGRAIGIQGIDSAANAQAAADRMTQKRTLKPTRGTISDRNGQTLASTQPAVKVIADPTAIAANGYNTSTLDQETIDLLADQTPRQIAEVLVRYLGGTVDSFLPVLTKTTREDGSPDQYELLASKVPADTYQQILDELDATDDALGHAGLYGITKEDDPVRVYPSGTLASNVVGFVNTEGAGAGGFEYYEDDSLAGEEGYEQYESGQYGRIPLGNSTLKEAVDGTNYELTIDAELQYEAQQLLNQSVSQYNAVNGTTIAINVKTGEILAMATTPSYDSNDPGSASSENLGNRAVTDAYEPGSVEKVFTMAALLDAGLINPDTKVEVPGAVTSGSGEIRDADLHSDTKYMTARGVLYNSSNIGSTLLSRLMDTSEFHDYLANFGLGSSTGIQLPGESSGYLPDADMEDYTRDQMSFGQGMSVTAIQMAAGLAAVTNGGVYHQPTLIKSATDTNDNEISLPTPTSRRVISEDASSKLLNMMEAVTAGGTGYQNRMIDGYRMGGKSGTAQVINPETGTYDANLYMSSYVTVAPIDDPQILVYTVMEVRDQYGGTVAMPTSRDLMKLALPRYGVLPEADVQPDTDPLTYEP